LTGAPRGCLAIVAPLFSAEEFVTATVGDVGELGDIDVALAWDTKASWWWSG